MKENNFLNTILYFFLYTLWGWFLFIWIIFFITWNLLLWILFILLWVLLFPKIIDFISKKLNYNVSIYKKIFLVLLTIFLILLVWWIEWKNNEANNKVIIKNEKPLEKEILAKDVNIKASYDIQLDYTDRQEVNIKVELENIKKLTINEKEILIGTWNFVNYKLPLYLWDNTISIVWEYDNFKKRIIKNIKRVNRMEDEKNRLEKLAKIEKDKKDKENAEQKAKEQFSAWDWSHKKLTNIVKNNLKDPDSYKHIETTYSVVKNLDDSYYVVVFMKYRAKNSFWGYVIWNIKAFYDLEWNPVNLENWVE